MFPLEKLKKIEGYIAEAEKTTDNTKSRIANVEIYTVRNLRKQPSFLYVTTGFPAK